MWRRTIFSLWVIFSLVAFGSFLATPNPAFSADDPQLNQIKAKVHQGIPLAAEDKTLLEEYGLATSPNIPLPDNYSGQGVRENRAYIEIGTGTSTNYYVPFYGYYNFSWSQVIYLQSEIGQAIDINGISYHVSNTPSSYTKDDQQIFLGHTSDANFASGTLVDTTGMTKVYDGSVTWDGTGWHHITFDNSFSYNNSDNLLVIWVNNDGSYASGYPNFYYTSQTDRAVYDYQDSGPSSPGDAGTLTYRAANVRLHYETPYGVSLTPASQSATGATGVTVIYTLTVTNDGTNDDSFDITVDATWTTTPSVTNTGTITAGSFADITVDVEIPSGASTGDVDTATVTATSVGGGSSYYDDALLITTAQVPATLPFTEGFEISVPPPDWEEMQLSGTVDWSQVSSGTSPTCSPYAGGYMAKANFYSASSGENRLITPIVDMGVRTPPRLTFWMTRDPGYSSAVEGIVIEVSVDGGDFDSLATFLRYWSDPFAWEQKIVDLTAYQGETNVRIAFKAFTDYGNNLYLDSVVVEETPLANEGDVVINELIATPTSAEAIELANITPVDINVGGWILDWGYGFTYINTGETVPAGGYLVLTNDNTGPDDISVSNSGAVFELFTPDSAVLIDQVGYGKAGGAPRPIYNWSIAREPDMMDTDDDALDFNMDTTPTMGTANDAPAIDLGGGTVVVNEVYPGTGTDGFIELYNFGPDSVEITDWMITIDDDAYLNDTLSPGGLYVLSQSDFPPYFDLDATNDNIYLFDSSGVRLDQMGWAGHTISNSLQRYPDAAGPNDGWDYLTSGGDVTLFDRSPTEGALNVPSTLVYSTGFEVGQDSGSTTYAVDPWILSQGFTYTGSGASNVTVNPSPDGETTFNVIPGTAVGYSDSENSWWFNTGVLDLSGYASARLTADIWYMTEQGWDYCYIAANDQSLDGTTYWVIGSYTGDSQDWVTVDLDLTPFCGTEGGDLHDDIKLALIFISDALYGGDDDEGFGFAVDNISVEGFGTFLPQPRNLVAESWYDAMVPLHWSPPVGSTERTFTTFALSPFNSPIHRSGLSEEEINRIGKEKAVEMGLIQPLRLQSVVRTYHVDGSALRQDVTDYNIYRMGPDETEFSLLAAVTDTSYDDMGLTNNELYSYFVTAVYDIEPPNESGASNVATARPGIPGDVLLLGDNVSAASDTTDWQIMERALNDIGVSYTKWDAETDDYPSSNDLTGFTKVVLFSDFALSGTDEELDVLSAWLASGGNSLFISGKDVAWDIGTTYATNSEQVFWSHFGTNYAGDYSGTCDTLLGTVGDPISGAFPVVYGEFGSNDYADSTSQADIAYVYGNGTSEGDLIMTYYETVDWRTVWYGGNYTEDFLSSTTRDQDSVAVQDSILARIINWFESPPTIPGYIEGTVTDAATGDSIAGAVVEAGDQVDTTDANGYYLVTLLPGTYMVSVSAWNYAPQSAEATVVGEDTTVVDFALSTYLPPPMGLMSTSGDAVVDLVWNEPMPMGEIAYDDGNVEHICMISFTAGPTDYMGVRFTSPLAPPYTLTDFAIYTMNGDDYAGDDTWASIMVVSDSMGVPNLDDVLYEEIDYVVYSPSLIWEFFSPDLAMDSSVFWVLVHWPEGSYYGPWMARDPSTGTTTSFYSSDPATGWTLDWAGKDYVIRAYVSASGRSGELTAIGGDQGSFRMPLDVAPEVIGKSALQKPGIAGSFFDEIVGFKKGNMTASYSNQSDLAMAKRLANKEGREPLSAAFTSLRVPTITSTVDVRSLQSYTIYRSQTPGIYTPVIDSLANTTDLFYTDLTVTNGETYYYVVTGVYDEGVSDYSNEVLGNPEAAIALPFFTDFEQDAGGMHLNGVWEWGTPTTAGGPDAAYSGIKCVGTDLDFTYPIDAFDWMISPPFDLSTAENVVIEFAGWYELESGYDYGYLAVDHDNDGIFDVLDVYNGYETAWAPYSYIIPDSLTSDYTKIAFIFESDGSVVYRGWFVDDLLLGEGPAIVYSPTEFDVYLNVGGSTSEELTITNTGVLDLEYDLSVFYPPLFFENFAAGLPADWDTVDNTGNGGWVDNNPGGRTDPLGNCVEPFMVIDSDEWGMVDIDAELITPSINCSDESVVYLEFDHYFNYLSGEVAAVDVSVDGGTNWNNIVSWSSDDTAHVVFDISAYAAGQRDVRVRFHYYDANYDWYWMVDNVVIRGAAMTEWLTLDPTSGTVPADETDTIDVSIDATGLPGGYYYAGLVIQHNAGPPDRVDVNLTVVRALTILDAKVDADEDFVPDLLGEVVTVTGVVTSPCFGATDHTDYYIQDATAGINLFKYYDYTELDIGDEVQVMGEIDQYRGKTEIIPLSLDDIVVLSTGNDFDTTGVTIPDFGEFIEGLLVELEEVWLVDPAQWPSPGSWANVDITDGTDTLILYIDSDTDVDEMDAPTYNFALVGIGTQYTYSTPPDDGYEIMPRFQADFTEIVGIDELADLLPTVYDLHQNYPNPFNPNTTIKFDVVDPGHLSLKVYNILGQEVTTLVDQQMEPGFHSIRWNATGVATGVYFYRIEVNDFVKIRKMVLLK